MTVTNGGGKTVFESGRHDAAGQLIDSSGAPLPSELAGGPYVALSTTVGTASGPQIYEVVMGDTDGAVTYRLLLGARYLKDNRMLPRGWTSANATDDIKVIGVTDDDFVGGGDRVGLDVAVDVNSGPFVVTATLLYQPLGARYAAELFKADTAEVRAFRAMYERADRTPELIATATITVTEANR